jgi:hypothetical protein
VALGCTAVLALLVIAAAGLVFAGRFFESGADTGETLLGDREAYAKGSVEYIKERNFYLVRLGDGAYLALADIDAANRANTQRRCRVAPIDAADPALPALIARYGAVMSPPASGSTLLLREDCNGVLYDVAGARLDREGPNLDRFPVRIGEDRRLRVDLSKRICTARAGADPFATTSCR